MCPIIFLKCLKGNVNFILINMGRRWSAWIDHSRVMKLWQQSVEWGVESLILEILVGRQIYLSNPYSAFIVMGDLGARIFFYYAIVEDQWILKQQFIVNAERREVSWQEDSLFQFEKTTNRLDKYLRELMLEEKPLLNLHGQVPMDSCPVNFIPTYLTIDLLVVGHPLTLRYLGQSDFVKLTKSESMLRIKYSVLKVLVLVIVL